MDYLVKMFNGSGCAIDWDIIEAIDEQEAYEKFIEIHKPIVYWDDTFKIEEIW